MKAPDERALFMKARSKHSNSLPGRNFLDSNTQQRTERGRESAEVA